MKCKICSFENSPVFKTKILKKYVIQYYYCSNCGFVQTEKPFWLAEAYKDSINISDTGYMQRNINLSKKTCVILALFFDKHAKYIDYAGGYGVFCRLMRDIGFDFYWDDKYSKNLFAKGFEHEIKEKFEVVTTFESFEHFVNPLDEIEKLLGLSKNIIFSTQLIQYPIPQPTEWWYYGLDHGQHISFYSEKTLKYIAREQKLYLYSYGKNFHLLTENKLTVNFKMILALSDFLFFILHKTTQSKTLSDMGFLATRGKNKI